MAADFPDAMIPAVYNANMRILQSPGFVAISYELIHDTRVIPLDAASSPSSLSAAIRTYMGDAHGRWEGTTLVVETSNLKANTRGASPGLRLIERFTRSRRDSMDYQVTFVDPGDVDRAVDRRPRHESAAGRCGRVRVRVPRGELRPVQHAGRLAAVRQVGRVLPRGGYIVQMAVPAQVDVVIHQRS